MNTKILFIVPLLGLLLLAGCTEKSTLDVTGESELTFEPDMAEISAGISILKDSAQDAQLEANAVINAIIDGLRAKGVSEDDIETERLNLYEDRRWKDGEYETLGWRATQTLKVQTKDLDKLGTVVDVAVTNGANQINSINFMLSPEKESEHKTQALADATKNAREKAETLAEGLDAKLGAIKTVSESNYYMQPRVYAMEAKVGDAVVAEAAQILPGDVTVTGRVVITYYLK